MIIKPFQKVSFKIDLKLIFLNYKQRKAKRALIKHMVDPNFPPLCLRSRVFDAFFTTTKPKQNRAQVSRTSTLNGPGN